MAVKMCPGSGHPVVPSARAAIYPACGTCGKEFSSQGRKSQHYRHNYWQDGAPRHHPAEHTCTFDDHGFDSDCRRCQAVT